MRVEPGSYAAHLMALFSTCRPNGSAMPECTAVRWTPLGRLDRMNEDELAFWQTQLCSYHAAAFSWLIGYEEGRNA